MAKDLFTAPETVYPEVSKSGPPTSTGTSEAEVSSSGSKIRTFAGAGLHSRFYKPLEKYEGNHRYDPDFDWEPEEEKRVVRKVGHSANCPKRLLTPSRLIKESAHGCA